MYIFSLPSSFKKEGKIQTGLNCEYDGLSEACLSLSHSSLKNFVQFLCKFKVCADLETLRLILSFENLSRKLM